MKKDTIKIDILPNYYKKEDGTFDKDKALNTCGKIAGVCYNKEGFVALENEDEEKTNKRIEMTLKNGHHSVYDHVTINLNIHNIPKILAMTLNNEKQYTTSEKSARYTPIERSENSIVTDEEVELYDKWMNVFSTKIKQNYGHIYNENKIKKLAQENARYLVTVFMPTEMIYSTSLRQINYIASFMNKYMEDANHNNDFQGKMSDTMMDFIIKLEELNVLDKDLMNNEKSRKLSLFGENIDKKDEYFGDIYQTKYKGTFAELAQAQRHRTINYQMNMNEGEKNIFIPPIIEHDSILTNEWIEDMNDVVGYFPQGKMIDIVESGTYEDFILKCKERLCSCAQLEINNQTKETLMKYRDSLVNKDHYLKDDIENYTHGARCTFPDYNCNEKCNFIEGKKLIRKI